MKSESQGWRGVSRSGDQAGKRFEEHYGFKISSITVDRVTKQSAFSCQKYLEERLRAGEHGAQQVTTCNGSDEPMLIDLDGCEIRTGTFAAPESGLQNGQTDGGHGLREGLENQFRNVQFILDKPHLKKHLYATASALGHGEDEQRQWVHSKLDRLSEGHADEVFKELEIQNTDEPNDRLRQFIGYLKRFKDAVDYDRFKELGYPIGSGEVESAHRSIPQKRLRLPGACSHPDSINPMLALRIVRANGWWGDYWEHRNENVKMAA